jgi:hypothetical protein
VPVALQRQVFPFTTPYAAVAGAAGTTDASGRYAFTVLALESARYGVLAPGYTIRDLASAVTVRILPVVTTRVTRVKHRRFVVSGRYLPSAPAEVTLFRIGHGAVIMPVQVRRSGTTGRAFRFAVRALKPGRYEVRVVPSASSGLARTHSTAFTIPRR